MEALPQNSNLPVLMKNRPFCQTAEELFFCYFVNFSWLRSIRTPTPFVQFFKRELSPLHNTCYCCQQPQARYRQTLDGLSPHLSSSFSTSPTNLSFTPLPSQHVPFLLLVSLAFIRLLLRMHFTDTPTETSELMSGQEVKGFKCLLWE